MSKVVDNDTLESILRDYERRIRLLETKPFVPLVPDAPDAGAIVSNSTGGTFTPGTSYASFTSTTSFAVSRASRVVLLGTFTATALPSTAGTYAYCRIALRNTTGGALIFASLPSVIQHATADRYTSLPLHAVRAVAVGNYQAHIETFADVGIQLTWTYAEIDALVLWNNPT